EFYAALAAKLALLGCPAIAVWAADRKEPVRLLWSSPGAAAEQTSEERVDQHEPEVVAAVESGQPKVTDSIGGKNVPGAFTGRSVIAPWSSTIATHGAVQVWLAERASSAAISGYLRVLSAVADIVGGFLGRQQQQRSQKQFEVLSR